MLLSYGGVRQISIDIGVSLERKSSAFAQHARTERVRWKKLRRKLVVDTCDW